MVTTDDPPPRRRHRDTLSSSLGAPPSSLTVLPEIPSTDSFVRLVTLRLSPEADQPYLGLSGEQQTPQSGDNLMSHLFVRYHDVDGVLDFLVLRNVFDQAIVRSWNTG